MYSQAPPLYMLGAAGAKDSDHLSVLPTRKECMKELTFTHIQVSDETGTVRIDLTKKMQFMNGDNPAVEFEDSKQKGEHFGCVGCCGDMRWVSEYDYVAYQKKQSLEEKQGIVFKGKFGKYDVTAPFKSRKGDKTREELKSRRGNPHSSKNLL